MTMPTSDPLPMPHPDDTPPAAGRRLALPVIGAVVAGVLVGVGVGFLLFDGGGEPDVVSSEEATRAAALADTGCGMIERIDREYASEDDFGALEDDSVYWEAPAAGYLLVAAATIDPQYADLEEAGQTTIAALSRMRLEDLSADAAAACAAR